MPHVPPPTPLFDTLQQASYRGVPFLVSSISVAGGRKVAKKRFVNSDLQLIEDLGLRQPTFTVSGIVAAQRDNEGHEIRSYQEVRDALTDALNAKGPGVFVHPFRGRLDDISCVNFSIGERMTSLGESSLEITFEVSNTTGVPLPQKSVLGSVVTSNNTATAAIGKDIDDRFSVTDSNAGNFGDAIDKVNEMINDVNEATSPAAILAVELDEFSAELATLTANVATLVDNPTQLSDSITNLWNTMNGLYSTPEVTFDAFVRLFDFGDLDVPFVSDTSGRIERKKNRDVLNSAVQGISLSFAYLNASQIDFATTEDIDAISATLEAQYQKLLDSGTLDSTIEEELTKMRIQVNTFFDDQKLTKPQIREVRTNLTSTRLLAYQYYGSSDRGDTIAELNGFQDGACIEGDVKILTV